MEMLLGALGAAVVLCAFGAGGVLGWKLREREVPSAPLETVQEAQRLREEAFSALQSYNAERAYGMLHNEEVCT